MAQISAELLEKLQSAGEARVQLIIRTSDDPGQYIPLLEERDIEVQQRYRLTNRLAVQGPAVACLSLLSEPWVEAVEEDRPVHTWTA